MELILTYPNEGWEEKLPEYMRALSAMLAFRPIDTSEPPSILVGLDGGSFTLELVKKLHESGVIDIDINLPHLLAVSSKARDTVLQYAKAQIGYGKNRKIVAIGVTDEGIITVRTVSDDVVLPPTILGLEVQKRISGVVQALS